jgi:hypothetical protein
MSIYVQPAADLQISRRLASSLAAAGWFYGMNTSQFRFEIATEADDPQLRRRMAEDWMRGGLSVSFRREPSYFTACCVQGRQTQVIKCTELKSNRIIGMGSRAMRTVFLNGVPSQVGYLSDLRCHPDYRNGTLLARGYRFLRQLHQAEPVPLYFTMILDGNQSAMRALMGRRAGLPAYCDLGRVLTPAVHLDLPKWRLGSPGVSFQRAGRQHLRDLLHFLHRWHALKQFAPFSSLQDFASPRLRDLRPEDFFLAIRNDRMVACCAVWDQRSFRQTHIEEYSPGLDALRPTYNFAARYLPLKRLPSPGGVIPYFYLSFVAVEENDLGLFRCLLRHVYREMRSGPWHYFIAGLHERDPLSMALADYRRIEAAGRLFVVHYEDSGAYESLEPGRIPYVEMATL